MSPLDAARRLRSRSPHVKVGDTAFQCPFCAALSEWIPIQHAPDCPWLAMPRIIEALEAADDIRRLVNYDSEEHFMSAALARFDAAMQGEEVTA